MPTIESIKEWQGLVGAVIGSIGALLVALIVADAQESRERRAAGAILHGDLIMFGSAGEALARYYPGAPEDRNAARAQAWEMLRDRPSLSPLFDSSMGKLLELDEVLDHHLHYFRHDVSAMERALGRLDRVREVLPVQDVQLDGERLFDIFDAVANLQGAAWHSSRAEQLLLDLALTRAGLLRRFVRRFRPNRRRASIDEIDVFHLRRGELRRRILGGP